MKNQKQTPQKWLSNFLKGKATVSTDCASKEEYQLSKGIRIHLEDFKAKAEEYKAKKYFLNFLKAKATEKRPEVVFHFGDR